MSQNTSSAVMQQRTEPHDSLDDFPTPPWATRALCEWLKHNYPLHTMNCRESAANRGHMVRPLSEYFGSVEGSDVHDYSAGFEQKDYLFGAQSDVDFTITNPPFKLALEFGEVARRTSTHGCALLLRSAFLEGVQRYNELFSQHPPSAVMPFAERVVMHRGKLAPNGSTATAYAWFVWLQNWPAGLTEVHWIPPCRKRLELASDYEVQP